MTTFYSRIAESVEDLLAKSHYMLAKCQVDGNLTFDSHRKTVEESDNESRCRSLCLRIEKALESCREEEILALLEMYDLLYRIGYGKLPDQRFIVSQRNRVFAAWKSGNRDIQESQIYCLMKRSLNGRSLANNMLKNWVRTLAIHNHFPDVITYENYQRLALIMREKVDNALKRKWFQANKIEDFSTLSTPLLKNYRGFITSLYPAVIDYECLRNLDSEILENILVRYDLNPYDRKTFTFAFNKDCVLN